MLSSKLYTELTYLKGVGPSKADVLKKDFGIVTLWDLLNHFPFRYENKTQFLRVVDLTPETKTALVKGKIIAKDDIGAGSKRRLVLTIQDSDNKYLELLWFRSITWVDKQYNIGENVIVYGRVTEFRGNYSMNHPEIEKEIPALLQKEGKIKPIYSSTEKAKVRFIDSKFFETVIEGVVLHLTDSDILEIIPPEIQKKYQLISRKEAYQKIHYPKNEQDVNQALRRLKFEELFLMQLQMVRLKIKTKRLPGCVVDKVGRLFNTFYQEFIPFELTNAQKKSIKEIREDLRYGFHMNRLLQGDVGSGKTIVAMMTMLLFIDAGFQTCLMAPTEILAQQHFVSFKEWIEKLKIKVALLTGTTKAKARKEILAQLENGEIQILIGTHALIEDKVVFKNLGLAIIDEQHKFGVAQRGKLMKKNVLPPHILVMTATPIPRSLALSSFGHMDMSIIDELPPGRKPIVTRHVYDSKRIEVMQFLRSEIKKGRQIYIVYPLIEESEKMDYESLERGYEEIKSFFPDMPYGISLVHGKQDSQLRETNMKRFISGETKILVATTVIEVGVNVSNASVMLIESSERFGLSQLHQLRGRVGRGAEQSYCILMTSRKIGEDAKRRLQIMVATNDGFRIAKEDLELRGPGQIDGVRQSGGLDLKMASIVDDESILVEARHTAINILEQDPNLNLPQHQFLKSLLTSKKQDNWLEVL